MDGVMDGWQQLGDILVYPLLVCLHKFFQFNQKLCSSPVSVTVKIAAYHLSQLGAAYWQTV